MGSGRMTPPYRGNNVIGPDREPVVLDPIVIHGLAS
jgi:hypothetical protein